MVQTGTSRGAPGGPGSAAVRRQRKRPAQRRRLTRRPLALLLALAFFFTPAVAFLAGARPQAIENRALSSLPTLSDGWSFFPKFTTWAVDHLPLRGEAVQANAAVSEQVFGEPPPSRSDSGGPIGGSTGSSTGSGKSGAVTYPMVIQGKNGWLYYGSDTSNLCTPERSIPDTLARLDRLAKAVQSSGRRFVLAIAPDKSTIYPKKLPDTYVGKSCSEKRRTQFWNALRATPPAGYLDLRGPLEAAQKRAGVPLYRQTDTHWGPLGAGIYAERLARTLDPALLSSTELVRTGTSTRRGDLGNMIGAPHVDRFADAQLRRLGVVPVGRASLDLPEVPYSPETFTNRTTGAKLYAPPTLMLGDSFTSASGTALGPLFANVTLLHNNTANLYPQAVASLMASADTVIYEVVERDVASGRGGLISDSSLAAIEKTLAAQPR